MYNFMIDVLNIDDMINNFNNQIRQEVSKLFFMHIMYLLNFGLVRNLEVKVSLCLNNNWN